MRGVSLGFGGPPLLDHVDLQIERGERLCLLGRNGTGKTTLMKVIAGELTPDAGEVLRRQSLGVTRLAQEVPQDLDGSVYDIAAGGLGETGRLLREYHHVSQELGSGDSGSLHRLSHAQHALEAAGGWEVRQRVETVLSRLRLDPDMDFSTLSGGVKRRVLLARALVSEPDLLLLDEPTNHLDIEVIRWLEDFLLGYGGTLLFVTHDRRFLQRLATRIIELDRGRLTDWPGDYAAYLRRKQERLETEARQEAEFDRKLSREEAWIRQGIKARRTRNEGRVRALAKLRETRRGRRGRMGNVRMALEEAERSGALVVEAEAIGYDYGGHPFIRDFSTTILRGDRVGIIGPNGSGKTTLLQLLLGHLPPHRGTLRLGTRLEVAYFDQHRSQLEEDKTVLDNVAGGRERIGINGGTRHVISYLQDFLFAPERARTPVRALSGGERNRLLLARLFARPCNVLVMDEPTNDLDLETLELLEERLLNFQGTLLLVSHDRSFLNNVVTSTLVFEGSGRINEYVGGYDDWLRQKRPDTPDAPARGAAKPPSPRSRAPGPQKLGYREQRELEALPQRIEALEEEQSRMHEALSDPALYRGGGEEIAATKARLADLEGELVIAYGRWEELEALREREGDGSR